MTDLGVRGVEARERGSEDTREWKGRREGEAHLLIHASDKDLQPWALGGDLLESGLGAEEDEELDVLDLCVIRKQEISTSVSEVHSQEAEEFTFNPQSSCYELASGGAEGQLSLFPSPQAGSDSPAY